MLIAVFITEMVILHKYVYLLLLLTKLLVLIIYFSRALFLFGHCFVARKVNRSIGGVRANSPN